MIFRDEKKLMITFRLVLRTSHTVSKIIYTFKRDSILKIVDDYLMGELK